MLNKKNISIEQKKRKKKKVVRKILRRIWIFLLLENFNLVSSSYWPWWYRAMLVDQIIRVIMELHKPRSDQKYFVEFRIAQINKQGLRLSLADFWREPE